MAKRLTAQTVEAIKPPERDRMVSDGDGLFLRVRAHGAKTWVIEYEFQERRRKYTIGIYTREGGEGESVTDWLRNGRQSLAQARAIAGAWKAARRGGHDPVAEWEDLLDQERAALAAQQAAIEAEKRQPTVNDAIDEFMTKIISGKVSAQATRYRLDRLAGIIGTKKIRETTRQDIIAALDTIATGQRAGKPAKQLAGEVLILAKRLWRFAAGREWLDGDSPIETLTRADFDARPKKRDVALRLDELVAIWRALGDREACKADPVTIAAMKLLILTGQRENEVCGAEWSEIDLKAGEWGIPARRTKTRKAHLVHLAPQSVSILREIKSLTGKQKHVFASPLRDGQAVYGRSVNNALLTLFKNGKLPNVTQCHVHDFRRTFITRLPDLGFEPFIAHKIANHALPGVLGTYNLGTYETQRRDALMAWAARIEALATGGNVKQLHRAA